MKTIFEKSRSGRRAGAQGAGSLSKTESKNTVNSLPAHLLRKDPVLLPEASELQVVRHYTQLSRRNFSIDTNFYPLGSCTMKYNPRGAHRAAMTSGWVDWHPLSPEESSQGALQTLFELQEALAEVTGMQAVSLTPMAGAQGEFAGVAMIRAYHESRNDHQRQEIIVPAAAHGTNPATAVMCGYKVREIPINASGDVDIDALRAAVGPNTAGLMMTNPSTCGVFERQVAEIAQIVHEVGGLLYYDGANLNAILGQARPGDMGFDVLHLNLHKTFATPHGGGGPGAGPVAANHRLAPFLPIPRVGCDNNKSYFWLTEKDAPQTIGRLSTFQGNFGVLARAFAYIQILGSEGLRQVGEFATLNANYLMARLEKAGFQLAFPNRRATHEFIISFEQEEKKWGVTAMDFAKRLLDFGIHAPTTYFPLLVPECWLIEPTETESKEELDHFVEILIQIRQEAEQDAALLKKAPFTTSVRRVDEVKAAREMILTQPLAEWMLGELSSVPSPN
ncbi:MAG: aminomethyl-transferring glycine dehydrogenase subunit GcvPB [Pseudomonadota bacterium]